MNWITEIGIGDDQGHITTLTTLDPTGVEYTSLEWILCRSNSGCAC